MGTLPFSNVAWGNLFGLTVPFVGDSPLETSMVCLSLSVEVFINRVDSSSKSEAELVYVLRAFGRVVESMNTLSAIAATLDRNAPKAWSGTHNFLAR
jgi:hypothetical protein